MAGKMARDQRGQDHRTLGRFTVSTLPFFCQSGTALRRTPANVGEQQWKKPLQRNNFLNSRQMSANVSGPSRHAWNRTGDRGLADSALVGAHHENHWLHRPCSLFPVRGLRLLGARHESPCSRRSKDLCVAPHNRAMPRRAAPAVRSGIPKTSTRVTGSPPFHDDHVRSLPHAGCCARPRPLRKNRRERQRVKSIAESWRISAERLKLVSPFTNRHIDSKIAFALTSRSDRAAMPLTRTDSPSPQHYAGFGRAACRARNACSI